MKFVLLAPALCGLAAAVPVDLNNAGLDGALDTTTGAVQDLANGDLGDAGGSPEDLLEGVEDIEPGIRDLDFDSTMLELDVPITVGEGLVNRDSGDDIVADTGLLEAHIPIDILPASDKGKSDDKKSNVRRESGYLVDINGDGDVQVRERDLELGENVSVGDENGIEVDGELGGDAGDGPAGETEGGLSVGGEDGGIQADGELGGEAGEGGPGGETEGGVSVGGEDGGIQADGELGGEADEGGPGGEAEGGLAVGGEDGGVQADGELGGQA